MQLPLLQYSDYHIHQAALLENVQFIKCGKEARRGKLNLSLMSAPGLDLKALTGLIRWKRWRSCHAALMEGGFLFLFFAECIGKTVARLSESTADLEWPILPHHPSVILRQAFILRAINAKCLDCNPTFSNSVVV